MVGLDLPADLLRGARRPGNARGARLEHLAAELALRAEASLEVLRAEGAALRGAPRHAAAVEDRGVAWRPPWRELVPAGRGRRTGEARGARGLIAAMRGHARRQGRARACSISGGQSSCVNSGNWFLAHGMNKLNCTTHSRCARVAQFSVFRPRTAEAIAGLQTREQRAARRPPHQSCGPPQVAFVL